MGGKIPLHVVAVIVGGIIGGGLALGLTWGLRQHNEVSVQYLLTDGTAWRWSPDGKPLTLVPGGRLPEGAVLRGDALEWTPDRAQAGRHRFAVATEAWPNTTLWRLDLTVAPGNHPPRLVPPPELPSVSTLDTWHIAVTVEDDTTAYPQCSLVAAPAGVALYTSPDRVELEWTPSVKQSGEHTIQLAATDGEMSATIAIPVTVVRRNQPPRMTRPEDVDARPDDQVRLQLHAEDPDEEQLRYQLVSGPAGMQVDATTGLLTWKAAVVPDSRVTVRVADQAGATSEASFRVLVHVLEFERVIGDSPLWGIHLDEHTMALLTSLRLYTTDTAKAGSPLSQVDVDAMRGRLTARDGWIYIQSDSGLTVIDAHDPAALNRTVTLPLAGRQYPSQPWIVGDCLYLLTDRLCIYSLAKPGQPRLLKQLDVPNAVAFTVDDKYLSIATNAPETLRVYSIGKPADPQLGVTCQLRADGTVMGLFQVDGLYLVSTNRSQFQAFSRDGDQLTPVGKGDLGFTGPEAAWKVGQLLFVAGPGRGVVFFMSPFGKRVASVQGTNFDGVVCEDGLWRQDTSGQMKKISGIMSLDADFTPFPGYSGNRLASASGKLIVSDSRVVSSIDPTTGSTLASIQQSSYSISGWNDLVLLNNQLFRVDDAGQFSELGRIDFYGKTGVDGNRLYVSAYGRYGAYDLTDPAQPKCLTTRTGKSTLDYSNSLAVRDATAYSVNRDGKLDVHRLLPDGSAELIKSYGANDERWMDLAFAGKALCSLSNGHRLQVWDARDPANLVPVAALSSQSTDCFTTWGNHVVTADEAKLSLYRLTSQDLELVDEVKMSIKPRYLMVIGDRLIAGTTANGLVVYRLPSLEGTP